MSVWQKLLMPAIAGKFVRDGLAEIGGPVVRAADVVTLSPAELVASYGLAGEGLVFPANPEYVDLLRFTQVPLMRFTAPDAVGERPWPTYENGFLRAPSRAPVWNLARTRVPMNAEIWRKYADGREELLAHYGSLSKGWTEARGYYPPLHLVGARAKWRGLDLPAEFLPNGQEGVELVWMGDEGTPAGFEEVRPAIHRRLVPFSECEEIFEVVITASWNGIRVRVLQRAGDEALVLLENPEWDEVTRIRAGVVEPGIFEATVPFAELVDVESIANVFTAGAGATA